MSDPDWKEIAMGLAQRVNFACTNLKCPGGGLMLNTKTGQATHWRDYMADGLELIPGIKIDREMMFTFDLPASKQKKARQEIKVKRETETKEQI